MQMIVDIDQQPPYVELYSDAPLMCASLVNTRQAMAGSTSLPELVYWCHGVHRVMDKVAGRLGLVKIKALSNDSQTCLFSISPDMPSRQQAEVMLHAAQQLLAALSQVRGAWHGIGRDERCQSFLSVGCPLAPSFWIRGLLFAQHSHRVSPLYTLPGCVTCHPMQLEAVNHQNWTMIYYLAMHC